MARAAIYYRVSTVDQSVNGQISELREYADKRGFEVAGEYVDHRSGAARERPELVRMMGDVRQRKADIVLVWGFRPLRPLDLTSRVHLGGAPESRCGLHLLQAAGRYFHGNRQAHIYGAGRNRGV